MDYMPPGLSLFSKRSKGPLGCHAPEAAAEQSGEFRNGGPGLARSASHWKPPVPGCPHSGNTDARREQSRRPAWNSEPGPPAIPVGVCRGRRGVTEPRPRELWRSPFASRPLVPLANELAVGGGLRRYVLLVPCFTEAQGGGGGGGFWRFFFFLSILRLRVGCG